MKVFVWTLAFQLQQLEELEHCQIIVTADSKEDAERIALNDSHLLATTKKQIIGNEPVEHNKFFQLKQLENKSILGIFPKYNYLVEVD